MDSNHPGSSARREYERLRQLREQRARDRFGSVGGWVARHTQSPQHENAWAIGAAGEARNAHRIARLVRKHPVEFLHDRHVPGTRASNIDHIAVGPGGVVVIDSKNVAGRVKVDWRGGLFTKREWDLYIGGHRRTGWVEALEEQVAVVQQALARSGYDGTPIFGALCMANGEGMPLIGQMRIRDVLIGRPRHVARRLTRDRGVPPHLIDPLVSALGSGLPPA